jgi:hypothetical protein
MEADVIAQYGQEGRTVGGAGASASGTQMRVWNDRSECNAGRHL